MIKIRFQNDQEKIEWLLKLKFALPLNDKMNEEKRDRIIEFLKPFNELPKGTHLVKLKLLVDICTNFNDIEIINHNFQNYYIVETTRERIKLRYGENALEEYRKRQSKAVKESFNPDTHVSCWKPQYWTQRGMTEEEAKSKVSELQSSNSKKRDNSKILYPISIKYWIAKGYSKKEAEELRQPYVDKCAHTIENYIKWYGYEEGVVKYNAKIKKD